MTGTVAAAIVPHHRVDGALHAKAKAKAKADGVSLSQVAEAGLRDYASGAGKAVRAKAQAKVRAGRLTRESPSLPETAARQVRDMAKNGDPRLTPYLAALRDAGWSYATLARPLGVSRQAVHLRLAHWDGAPPAAPLPAVPLGAGKTTFPAHGPAPKSARFDWAVWVDRELYAVAAEQARAAGEQLRDVMEGILARYVSGALRVTAATGAADKPTRKPRRRA